MGPFRVDENWFEDYWYSDRAVPKPQSFGKSLAGVAACLFLVAGGAAVVVGSAGGDRSSDPHPRPHIRLM